MEAHRTPGEPGGAAPRLFQGTVPPGEHPRAVDFLAALAPGLSRRRLKEAMAKGAVWLGRQGRERRLRRATYRLRPGDRLLLYHDPRILEREPPRARLLHDAGRWSAWLKPPGLLTQGSRWGDHSSLERQAARLLGGRPVHLVQRLDREAGGLLVVAHDRGAAARLGEQLRRGEMDKAYLAEVLGDLAASHGPEGEVAVPLDRKEALTRWRVLAWDPERGASLVALRIVTGRRHQIRRHLEILGHPVLGDPRYGRRNKNREGLRLAAVGLAFRDPASGRPVALRLDPRRLGFPAPPPELRLDGRVLPAVELRP